MKIESKHAFLLNMPEVRCRSSIYALHSVTSKKSPHVCKCCPKFILVQKWYILTPLQKLLKNAGDLGKLIVAYVRLRKVAQSPINRPIWSHCLRTITI